MKLETHLRLLLFAVVLFAGCSSVKAKYTCSYFYDEKDRRIKEEMRDAGDFILRMVEYGYDASGRPASIVAYNRFLRPERQAIYHYDDKGKCERLEMLDGRSALIEETTYRCDDKGAITEELRKNVLTGGEERTLFSRDPSGNVTRMDVFDVEGGLKEVREYEYDAQNRLVARSGSQPSSTMGMVIEHDDEAYGLVKPDKLTDAARYFYDDEGRLLKEELFDPARRITIRKSYQYDVFDNPVLITWFDEENQSIAKELLEYDWAGKLIKTVYYETEKSP